MASSSGTVHHEIQQRGIIIRFGIGLSADVRMALGTLWLQSTKHQSSRGFLLHKRYFRCVGARPKKSIRPAIRGECYAGLPWRLQVMSGDHIFYYLEILLRIFRLDLVGNTNYSICKLNVFEKLSNRPPNAVNCG